MLPFAPIANMMVLRPCPNPSVDFWVKSQEDTVSSWLHILCETSLSSFVFQVLLISWTVLRLKCLQYIIGKESTGDSKDNPMKAFLQCNSQKS
jgi:hypothetical protein